MSKHEAAMEFVVGYGWQQKEKEVNAFKAGYDVALRDVFCVLGGCSPVFAANDPKRVEIIQEIKDKIDILAVDESILPKLEPLK